MKKIVRLLCISLLTGTLLCGCSESTSPSGNPADGDLEISNKSEENPVTGNESAEGGLSGSLAYADVQNFSYELLKNSMDKENPVLSPVSAYIALSMVGNGAKSETLAQFQEVLGGDLLTTPADMMNKLPRKEDRVKLTLANSAWLDETVTVNKDWTNTVERFFRADIYNQKLATGKAMKNMNKWVDTNTDGLIEKMLEKPMDENCRLVLFNALYFKADWKKKFDGLNTYEAEFHPEEGSSRRVNMMRMMGENQQYVKNDVAEGVVLPYADEDLVFLALKPVTERADGTEYVDDTENVDGTEYVDDMTVREMYDALTWKDISEFLQQEEETLCNLKLPKFQVEFDESLNEPLVNMGLADAFDVTKADFSGLGSMENGNDIYVSLVRQKALVTVDEEGTEAAAVTEVAACDSAALMEEEPVNIYFDVPFLYMIADKRTCAPLFIGIMDCPDSQ